MAKPVTTKEREQIVAEFSTGKSCNAIAKQFGRSPSTISRIARDAGHQFAYSNALHAQEAKAVYDSERRSKIIATELEAIERMQKERFSPALVHAFGGRDNVFNSEIIPEPDHIGKRNLTSAISTAVKTVIELDRAEQSAGADDMLVEFTMAIQQRRREREQADTDDASE